MRFLVSFTVVPVIANIVIAIAAETVAPCLPLSRRAIQWTSLQGNGTRSVVFEDDKAHEQKRDNADTKPD